MNDFLFHTWKWIKEDYQAHALRFVVEVTAWAISIGCSLWMAATVPHPPLIWIYPWFITGCVMYAWAAWTRQSFGMLANYLLLVTIDSVALARMWWA
jgi:hypothetical protein